MLEKLTQYQRLVAPSRNIPLISLFYIIIAFNLSYIFIYYIFNIFAINFMFDIIININLFVEILY